MSGNRPIRILAIHQGGELYGSDRSFAQCVTAFRRTWPDAEIHVVLGGDGPLADLIGKQADHLAVANLWIARKTGGVRGLVTALLRFLCRLPRILHRMRGYDLVYVNTIVILDYILPSLFYGPKTLIHVREIAPPSPLGRLLRHCIRHSRAGRIFNSDATARAYAPLPDTRYAVVPNGVEGPEDAAPPVPSDILKIALIGRINDWKGQDLAVEALSLVPKTMRARLHLRIVGSVFDGQEHVDQALVAQIDRLGLGGQVTRVPFSADVAREYAEADVVLVPSRRPEPFGRVAIEAMSYARPVIVADHGGLSDIVEQGVSGIKVPPNDAQALSNAIASLAANPADVRRLGAGARARYEDCFTQAAMERALIRAVNGLLARPAGGGNG